jgi:23S rRNA (adenine2503-C2)-methyltransferase
MLNEQFEINFGGINQCQQSSDGTRKWLLDLSKSSQIETVFIPEYDDKSTNFENTIDADERGSVCVSSQVGCSLTCSFCHTGTMPKSKLRNLTAGEIIGQLMTAKRAVGDFTIANTEQRRVSNIVFMGMGEPLLNYRNVKKALETIMDETGLSYGRRKITVSTSGVVPMIERLGKDTGVNLAISLHAVRDDLRDELVPINKQFPLHFLIDACKKYPGVKQNRLVTWEYVMLKDVNDSLDDARKLIKLVDGIPSLVNLIPFNPWPGSKYECSSQNQIHRFQQVLQTCPDLKCTIRWPRGRDILAACGQLAVNELNANGNQPIPNQYVV